MPKREKFQKDRYYHIFNRGFEKQTLFHNNKDFQRFLWYIDLSKEKYKKNLGIIAYCLLPNHFHFVFKNKTEKSKISKFIGNICASYTRYYKVKYEIAKGFNYFEGRFKSKILDNNIYLQQCIYYVENNPIKHGFVENIKDWYFTSYHSKKQTKFNVNKTKEILDLDREFF